MKRDWHDALMKVRREEICRLAQHDPDVECDGMLEAAHTVGRKYDFIIGPHGAAPWVNPKSIVPLCQRHHRLYDAHVLDLLPYMTKEEQADAVRRVGLIRALARLTGSKGDPQVSFDSIAVGEEPE